MGPLLMPAPQTEALHRALALIAEGWSIAAASREAGINKSAVTRYIQRQTRPICPCCGQEVIASRVVRAPDTK